MPTDNHSLGVKVLLRSQILPPGDGPVSVLDVYSGYGRCWAEVAKTTGREIISTRFEKRKIKGTLNVDSKRMIGAVRFSDYDVVDLDDYGFPFDALDKMLGGDFPKHAAVVTIGDYMFRRLHKRAICSIGFTEQMYLEAPSFVSQPNEQRIMEYLYERGVRELAIAKAPRAFYIAIKKENVLLFQQ